MELVIGGVKITRKENVITFIYKDMPVDITVVECITDKDLRELVIAKMHDIDLLMDDV